MYGGKAQSAIEFLSTYAWALLIIIVLLAVVFLLTSAPAGKQVLPSTCNIQPELPCQDSVLATLGPSSPITYYITFTNDLGKPILIQSGSFNVTTTGIGIRGTEHSFGDCYPSFVLPGTQVICKAAIAGNLAPSIGTKVSTLFSLSYQLCQSNIQAQCSSAPVYQSAGNGLQDIGNSNAASFFAVTFQIDDNVGTQTVSNNGTIILNGQQYTNGQTALFAQGGTLPVIAVPPNNFGFAFWTATSPSTIIPANTASSTLDLTANTTVTAVSNQITHNQNYFVSITANPSGGGTVSPASGYYAKGTVLVISESNSSNYKFASWTGTGTVSYTGTSTSNTITVNGPITEVASYTAIAPPSSLVANVPDLFATAGECGLDLVSMFNTTTANFIGDMPLSGQCGNNGVYGVGLAMGDSPYKLYALTRGAVLETFNLTTYEATNSLPLGGSIDLNGNYGGCTAGPYPAMAVSPNGSAAVVEGVSLSGSSPNCIYTANVVYVNLATNTIANVITLPFTVYDIGQTTAGMGVAIGTTQHGTEAFVADGSNVLVTNMNGVVQSTITGGFGLASPIALTADGSKAFVQDDYYPANIFEISTATDTVTANIADGGAFALATAPNNQHLYTSESGVVNVISIPSFTVTNSISVGNSEGITVSADSSKIFVGDYGGNYGGVAEISALTDNIITTFGGGYSEGAYDVLTNQQGLTSGVAPLAISNITATSQYTEYGDPCAYTGNSITFSDLGAYGGTPPYYYQWYGQQGSSPLAAIPGATGKSYVFTPTGAQTGYWKFYLNATDANGAKLNSGPAVSSYVYVYNAPNTATIFNPSGIVIDPTTDYAYVAQGAGCGQGYLTKVDLSTNSIVGSVQVSSNVPMALALAPSRSEAYLVNMSYGTAGIISVVDLSTFTQSGTISLQPTPALTYYSSIAVTPDNSLAYVSDGNSISVISLSSLSVVNTIATSNAVYSIVPYVDSTKLYAVGQDASLAEGGIYTINVASNTATYTPMPFEPYSLAVSHDGNYMFATSAPGYFYNLSTSGFTVNSNSLIENGFAGVIALNPSGNTAYVQSSNTFVVNVVGSSIVADIQGIDGDIATGPAGYPYEYVAGMNTLNNDAPGLFIVDQATNTVVNTIV